MSPIGSHHIIFFYFSQFVCALNSDDLNFIANDFLTFLISSIYLSVYTLSEAFAAQCAHKSKQTRWIFQNTLTSWTGFSTINAADTEQPPIKIFVRAHRTRMFFLMHFAYFVAIFHFKKVSIPMLMTRKKHERRKQTKYEKSCKTPFPLVYKTAPATNDTTSTQTTNSTIHTTNNEIPNLFWGYWLEIFGHTSYSFDILAHWPKKNVNENATMHCMMINCVCNSLSIRK